MDDIETTLQQLTLEEKAALCAGATPWETVAVPRLGIPAVTMADGPHGLRREVRGPDGSEATLPATCFPAESLLACSWDPALLEAVGRSLGEEARALGVDVLLAPGVNMKRTPLCGRTFEYYSEDPLLAGRLGAALVRGVQSRGVGTSLKHFACNNQETWRLTVSADVAERPLREIYLAAFEHIVREARPWTVMCSYNRLNGTYTSQDRHLLTDILRDEWGFDGIVVSDWGAVHDRVAGIRAGLDLEMPGPSSEEERLVAAVRTGELPEEALDPAVRRLLRFVAQVEEGRRVAVTSDPAAHHALVRRAAAESMVLLKNERDLLPLGREGSVAVIGRMAREPRFQGGGSSHVNASRLEIPWEALQQAAGGVRFAYAPGYDAEGATTDELLAEAARAARQADVALVFAGLRLEDESEGHDRESMDLPEGHRRLIEAVAAAQPRTAVVLINGAPVTVQPWLGKVQALLGAGLGGQAAGAAVADVLFGDVNPSGRLAESVPERLSHNPSYLNFPGEDGHVLYGEGLFIGYRYYDAKGIRPAFPFGFGLSYTTFELANLRCPAHVGPGHELEVEVDVSNTGRRPGKEVVQLYVHARRPFRPRPPKELKAFAKVALAPGETRTVRLRLTPRELAVYDPPTGRWVVNLAPTTCWWRGRRKTSGFRLRSPWRWGRNLFRPDRGGDPADGDGAVRGPRAQPGRAVPDAPHQPTPVRLGGDHETPPLEVRM